MYLTDLFVGSFISKIWFDRYFYLFMHSCIYRLCFQFSLCCYYLTVSYTSLLGDGLTHQFSHWLIMSVFTCQFLYFLIYSSICLGLIDFLKYLFIYFSVLYPSRFFSSRKAGGARVAPVLSDKFRMTSTRSGMPIRAPSGIPEMFPVMPFRQSQCWSYWRWPFLDLLRKVV